MASKMEIDPETVETWNEWSPKLSEEYKPPQNLFIGYYSGRINPRIKESIKLEELIVSGNMFGERRDSGYKFILHNPKGPALIMNKGSTASWILHGKIHRKGGPAVVDLPHNYVSWYLDGDLHRFDGPAIESTTKAYFVKGKALSTKVFSIIQNASTEEELLPYLTGDIGERSLAQYILKSLE